MTDEEILVAYQAGGELPAGVYVEVRHMPCCRYRDGGEACNCRPRIEVKRFADELKAVPVT